MQDTKVLLQQSRERLVITSVFLRLFLDAFLDTVLFLLRRVASDLSSFNTTLYNISVASNGLTSSGGKRRFHLGEPITINWHAPPTHSGKDWIGLYRVCEYADDNMIVSYEPDHSSVPTNPAW